MDPAPLPTDRDPEFHASAEPRLIEIDHAPGSYLRLVANPFLGLLGLLAWLAAAAWALWHLDAWLTTPFAPILLFTLVGFPFLLPRLFHYHCLDCGATGRLGRWRRHICPAAAERRRMGRPRRWHGPSPPTQVLLWLWGMLTLGILVSNSWRR